MSIGHSMMRHVLGLQDHAVAGFGFMEIMDEEDGIWIHWERVVEDDDACSGPDVGAMQLPAEEEIQITVHRMDRGDLLRVNVGVHARVADLQHRVSMSIADVHTHDILLFREGAESVLHGYGKVCDLLDTPDTRTAHVFMIPGCSFEISQLSCFQLTAGASAAAAELRRLAAAPSRSLTTRISMAEAGDSFCVPEVTLLGRFPAMLHLNLARCTLGAEQAHELAVVVATCRLLVTLNIAGNNLMARVGGGSDGSGLSALSAALAGTSSLMSANLLGCSIPQENARCLVGVLVASGTLVTLCGITGRTGHPLDVSRQPLGAGCAVLLAHELEASTSAPPPPRIVFSSDSTRDEAASSADGGQQAALITVDASAAEVDLEGLGLGPIGASLLTAFLPRCCSLRKLNLANNALTPDGARHLSQALQTNHAITDLSLASNIRSWSGDGPEFGEHLGAALQKNRSLRTLNIADNFLTATGAMHIAKALEVNTSLHSIDLSANALGPQGAFCIARALLSNCTLRCLSIVGNCIGCNAEGAPAPGGPTAIACMLECNSELSSLNIERKWAPFPYGPFDPTAPAGGVVVDEGTRKLFADAAGAGGLLTRLQKAS
jgi:hypothetical protein